VTPGPGWYRDPYFLQHERYWDDGWTDYVRRVDRDQSALGAPARTPALGASAATPALSPVTNAHNVGARPGAATAAIGVGAGMASRSSDGAHDTGTVPMATALTGGGETPIGEAPVVHADDTLAIPALRRDDDTIMVSPVSRVDDTLTVPAVPVDPDTLSVPVITGTNGTLPHSNGVPPAASNGAAPAVASGAPWDLGGPSADEAAAVRARARRRRLGLVAAGLVVVVIVVVAVLATRGGSGKGGAGGGGTGGGLALAGTGSSPASDSSGTDSAAAASPTAGQAVAAAATKSLGKQSVVVTVAHVAPGSTRSTAQQISGSGDFILQSGLGDFTATVPGSTPPEQNFVFQGQTLYVNVTDSPVPGTSWVVASTNNLPALGPSSSLTSFMEHPGQLVQQLTGTASLSVTSLGTGTVKEASVHRYRVGFSSSPATLSDAGFSSATSEEVDIGANGLVRQIVIPLAASGTDGQENVVVAFSHYGKAISVATPPASQQIPLSQYLVRPPGPTA
jgi:hypothetical protein